jgi:hypothetical protein
MTLSGHQRMGQASRAVVHRTFCRGGWLGRHDFHGDFSPRFRERITGEMKALHMRQLYGDSNPVMYHERLPQCHCQAGQRSNIMIASPTVGGIASWLKDHTVIHECCASLIRQLKLE